MSHGLGPQSLGALCADAGFCLMLCNKAVAKQAMLALLPAFYALYPVRLRRLWQPPVHSLQVSAVRVQQCVDFCVT